MPSAKGGSSTPPAMPSECGGFAADCYSIEQGITRSTFSPPIESRQGGSAAPRAIPKTKRRFPPHFLSHRARDCSIHLDIGVCVPRFTCSMIYRGFPSKLHHDVPHWVEPNSLFHIRIRLGRDKQHTPLTDAPACDGFTGVCGILRLQASLAHCTFSPHARSRSRAAGFSARRINESCHWRLETFSRAKESDRMAGGLFRSSIAQRRARGATARQSELHPTKSGRSGPMRKHREMAMGHR